MAGAFKLCSGPISGATGIGKGRALVSVQGDGVSCYDCVTQKPVLSWALGGSDQEFAAPAVYDYASNLCFAPLRPRGGGGGKAPAACSVLAWSADDASGTITQLAHPLHLPAVHRLFPLSRTPEGEAEEAAAAAAEERAAMEVDGSGGARAGALAVLAAGGAALCSGSEVVAEADEARGQHTVAAAYAGGRLVQVVAEPRSGAASAAVYRVEDGKQLQSEGVFELQPPAAGARAVAATATAERTAVLWSDGTVAVYRVPGDARPLLPLPEGGARQAAATRRLAGFRLPSSKQQQQQKGSSKKRSAAAEPDAPSGGVAMAAIGEKQVAVVGWATNSEGATVLRLVVLETAAACVQLAQDFAAADVGLAALDPSKPVQVDSLGGGQLAVSVGSAVLVASCSDLRPPTLANLLGALAIDKALLAQRSGGSSSSGSGSGASLLAPAAPGRLLGASAAASPAAAAAARVLHPAELEALAAPYGGAPRPWQHSMALADPSEPGQWLLPAKDLVWRCADEAGDARLAAEERRVWQQVQGPAAPALGSDAAMQAALAPLLDARRSTGLLASPQLVAALLMLAAEHGHWGAAAALVAAQPPRMLGDVPSLAAAAADAGRIDVLERLLVHSSDVPAAELAALLRVLLSPPSGEAATAGRQQRHAAAQAAAEAAERAARQALAAGPRTLQQQQEQQPPATASKPSRRRRKKKGAAAADGGDSDSDAEDLSALQPAAGEPGAMNGIAEAEQAGAPAAAAAAEQQQQQQQWLERPGAREQAVAACCRGAVEGFEPADSCLHPAVAAPLPRAVLLEALRSLAAEQAVALLRYLLALLRSHVRVVGGAAAGWQPPLALPPGVSLPPLAHAVAWANALIDSSLVKLSLQPEAKPLLAELAALVEALVAEARPLLRLGGIVSHLVSQRAVPRAAVSAADYSVQWLDLRVLPPEQRGAPQ